ncbi:MAG: hypothetical protein COB39_01730 [Marinosulfonomonas sp.]|nr:MAG: hypothetical protein COB39_01730 [Marinosulfonomonas sp.]
MVGDDWEDEDLLKFYGKSYRTVIQQMPNHQIREVKVPTGDFKTVGANLEDLYYAWNLAFIRDPEDIERPAPATVAPSFAGFGNSYLYLLRESLNETAMTATGIESINWLLDNIQIGRCAEHDFRDILD